MRWTKSFAAAHRLSFRKLADDYEQAECSCGHWQYPDQLEPYIPIPKDGHGKPKLESPDAAERRTRRDKAWREIFLAWNAHMDSRPQEEKFRSAKEGEPNFD